MRKLKIIFTVVLFIAFSVFSAIAQNQVDLTFNAVPSLAVNSANTKGQVVQADGKVVVWGGSLSAGNQTKGLVARLNSDGSLDTSFNFCSCSFSAVTSVALLADGKMLVSGFNSSNGAYRGKVVRINPDGSFDVTYSSPYTGALGSPANSARIRAIQPDGKSIVEAIFTGSQGASNYLARYHSNGLVDLSFTQINLGGNNIALVPDVVIAPDGKFYIASTTFIVSHSFASIKRYNPDGTVDASWNQPNIPQDSGSISGLDIQPDGSIVAGGNLSSVNGVPVNKMVRLFPAGNVDLTFAVSGFISIGQVKVLSGGKILVSASNGVGNPNRIYRLNSDGSIDSALADVGDKALQNEKEQSDPAAIRSGIKSAQEGEFAQSGSVISVLNRFALDPSENVVFFGQSDTSVQQFYRLSSNGTSDPGFVSNVAEFGKVSSMARQPDGKIVIAGTFIDINGATRPGFARLNTDGSLDGGFNPGTAFDGEPSRLLAQADGKILALGGFSSYNGTPVSGVARINSDGSLDSGFTPHVLIGVSTIALQSDGKILLGGAGVVRLNGDGTNDNSFSVTIGSANIRSLLVQADGKIIVGGSFSGVNGFNRSSLVRLNSDGSLDQTYNPLTSAGISSVWMQPDGKVLACSAGSPINMRRLNFDGSNDPAFAPVAFQGESARIYSVAFRANGEILVGGDFTRAGQALTANLAWLNPAGKVSLSIFSEGVNDDVRSLSLQPDGKLLLAGDFNKVDTAPRAGVARVNLTNFRAASQFDFDGDGRADISIFRPSDGNWYLARSTAGFSTINWGLNGDSLAAADYDGDGKTDLAVYRDGNWWYIKSTTNTFTVFNWGTAGDIPLPADFDGDGKADFIYFRPATGQWFRSGSLGAVSNVSFGQAGDIPLIADFDGDGKTDPTIFRPSTGTWWYLSSVNGLFYAHPWGQAGDIPVPGDYDGDGKTDAALFRPSDKAWHIINSHDNSYTATLWGFSDDRPTPADYDGDGRTDIAIYRPSNGMWFIIQSTGGPAGLQFGLAADKAVPNSYLP